MYAVFSFPKGAKEMDELYRDDIVSRQSIVKRDGKSLGLDDRIYIVVEGSDEGIKRAEKIAGTHELHGEEAERVYRKIKEADEAASLGMGAIFG